MFVGVACGGSTPAMVHLPYTSFMCFHVLFLMLQCAVGARDHLDLYRLCSLWLGDLWGWMYWHAAWIGSEHFFFPFGSWLCSRILPCEIMKCYSAIACILKNGQISNAFAYYKTISFIPALPLFRLWFRQCVKKNYVFFFEAGCASYHCVRTERQEVGSVFRVPTESLQTFWLLTGLCLAWGATLLSGRSLLRWMAQVYKRAEGNLKIAQYTAIVSKFGFQPFLFVSKLIFL